MKSRTILLLSVLSLTVVLLLACKPGAAKSANNGAGGDAANPTGSPTSAPNVEPTPKPPGYHELAGKIDKQDITMKLTRTGNQVSGTYQYLRIGKDISFKGTIGAGDAVELEEFGAGGDKPTGFFKGTWEDSADWPIIGLYGDWSKTKGAKDTLFFTLTEKVVDSSLKIETDLIKEESKKPNYTVDIGVPKIVGSSNPNAEKFNQLVKADLTKQAADFKKEIGDGTAPEGMDPASGSSFDAGYEVLFGNADMISVQFGISPYSAGAAHPGNNIETFVYDLKGGKLYKLSDLFTPGAKYLDTISKYCIDNLLKRLKPDGNGGMGSDPESVKTGAEGKPENYQNWNITKKGLLITFAPYAVASYADGPQYVTIPYSQLKSLVNPSGPIAGL